MTDKDLDKIRKLLQRKADVIKNMERNNGLKSWISEDTDKLYMLIEFCEELTGKKITCEKWRIKYAEVK